MKNITEITEVVLNTAPSDIYSSRIWKGLAQTVLLHYDIYPLGIPDGLIHRIKELSVTYNIDLNSEINNNSLIKKYPNEKK